MSLTQVTYASVTTDLGNILPTGSTPTITLFSDVDGTILFTDSNGNVFSDKVIASINHTEPHNDVDGNQIKNGFLTLEFTSGDSALITDNVDTVFYKIVAIPFKPRTF